ncbi:MAG: hypothetical protein ACYDCN_07805, partial [Bacteroidia bacterium]
QAAHSTYVPGLNPTAASVETLVDAIMNRSTGLIVQRDNARILETSLTEQINKGIADVESIITRQWMPQTEAALKTNANKISMAKDLLFGVKGIMGGKAQDISVMEMGKTKTSAPVIVKVDTDVKNEHIIHTHNNITSKRGHPKDVSEVDIYATKPGAALPMNLADLLANGGAELGVSERGVYINEIVTTTANKNLPIHYIAVYKGKKTKKPVAESNVFTVTIK